MKKIVLFILILSSCILTQAQSQVGGAATIGGSTSAVLQIKIVSLSWKASLDIVVSYNIYRSDINGSGYIKIASVNSPTLVYDDLVSSTPPRSLFYVATAVDDQNRESVLSNQATAVIP
jgi:fibronectin type 3 domain-containing protein